MTAVTANKRKAKRRDVVFPIVNACILVLICFITLFPVLNTVAYSFNDGLDALRGGIGIWPRVFSTEAYTSMLNDPATYKAFGISVSKAVLTTLLNLFFTSMLAYALSRKEYVLRKFITIVLVLTMYVNAGLIPNYLLVGKFLGLLRFVLCAFQRNKVLSQFAVTVTKQGIVDTLPGIESINCMRIGIVNDDTHDLFKLKRIIALNCPIQEPLVLHRRIGEIYTNGSVIFVLAIASFTNSLVKPAIFLDENVRHAFQSLGK